MFGSRILILVPHPDDEIVGFCAALGRAQEKGADIFALYLSHGCIAEERRWPWDKMNYNRDVARRLLEAEDAAALLDITQAHIATTRPARHIRHEMNDVAREIIDAVRKYEIDQLWVPAYEGGNADHDCINGLCGKMRDWLPPILEFAEYNFFKGLSLSQTFPHSTGKEETFTLTEEERAVKKAALSIYDSEKKNLGYVKLLRETCRPLASYDYSKPPHDGTLWYERFHWVPFKHPRIDFTRSEEVCEAICSFEPANVLPGSAKR